MDGMDIFEPVDTALLEDDEYQVAPIEDEDDTKEVESDAKADDAADDDTKKKEDNKEDEYVVAPKDDDTTEDSSKLGLTDKQGEQDSSNTISSFIKALAEEEILTLEEGREINTLEELYDVIREDKEKYLTEQLEAFPEAGYKEAFEAVRAGVPIEQVLGYQAAIEKYNAITDEAVEAESDEASSLRKQILIENFISKGFSQVKAEKFVKKLIDDGDDVEEAKEALRDLKSVEKAAFDKIKSDQKQAIKAAEDARQANIKEFETYLKDTTEIIPGYKVTAKHRKILYDSMTKGVGVIDGKQVDPLNKYLYENGLEGRAFLTEILLRSDYGKNKDILSVPKAKKEATKKLEKQLTTSASSNFSQENSAFSDDKLWDYVPELGR